MWIICGLFSSHTSNNGSAKKLVTCPRCGKYCITDTAAITSENNYKIKDAKIYADAYDVSTVWLLVGENDAEQKKIKARHKHNCSETIYAAALLLRDDPQNLQLLKKIRPASRLNWPRAPEDFS